MLAASMGICLNKSLCMTLAIPTQTNPDRYMLLQSTAAYMLQLLLRHNQSIWPIWVLTVLGMSGCLPFRCPEP